MYSLCIYAVGDATEDPQHPKIVWPSPADCPNCRTDSFNLTPEIAFVEGQMWNLTAVVQHNIKVYGAGNLLEQNPEEEESMDQGNCIYFSFFFALLSNLYEKTWPLKENSMAFKTEEGKPWQEI